MIIATVWIEKLTKNWWLTANYEEEEKTDMQQGQGIGEETFVHNNRLKEPRSSITLRVVRGREHTFRTGALMGLVPFRLLMLLRLVFRSTSRSSSAPNPEAVSESDFQIPCSEQLCRITGRGTGYPSNFPRLPSSSELVGLGFCPGRETRFSSV